MELHFDEDQTQTIIAALVEALNAKDENAGMSDFFMDRLKDRIKRQEEEIEALKVRIKALRPKKAKKPAAVSVPAPTKRGLGRPKKVVK
jgi:SMC interacting uncharacterized protein involved in chromosome segregation